MLRGDLDEPAAQALDADRALGGALPGLRIRDDAAPSSRGGRGLRGANAVDDAGDGGERRPDLSSGGEGPPPPDALGLGGRRRVRWRSGRARRLGRVGWCGGARRCDHRIEVEAQRVEVVDAIRDLRVDLCELARGVAAGCP